MSHTERMKDEKFGKFEELYQRVEDYCTNSRTVNIDLSDIVVDPINDRLHTLSNSLPMSDWSFRQLCELKRAPYNYLRRINSSLSSQCLNSERKEHKSLMAYYYHKENEGYVRAFTSPKYQRVYNKDVLEMFEPYSGKYKLTDMTLTDRTMMVFMTDPTPIEVPGDKSPLFKGRILRNSEVGASTLSFSDFIYRSFCTNHMIFGMKDETTMKHRHIGDIHEMVNVIKTMFETERPTEHIINNITKLQDCMFASSSQMAIDELRKEGFSKAISERAVQYAATEFQQFNAWAVFNGLTHASQNVTSFADDRMVIDLNAGEFADKILSKVA